MQPLSLGEAYAASFLKRSLCGFLVTQTFQLL